jgi:hypothetical protein
VEKPKNVGCNGRRGNVYVVDGGGMDLTVIGGAVKG